MLRVLSGFSFLNAEFLQRFGFLEDERGKGCCCRL